MSGIVGSRLNIRGSGLVGSLGTDGQALTSSGAGTGMVFEAAGGFGVGDITGATALATQPALTDEIVISDGGTLKRLDIKHIQNTPAFAATMSATQTDIASNTMTKIAFDTEVFDTDSAYDTSNYRFTPGVAGYYHFTTQLTSSEQSATNYVLTDVRLAKNGTTLTSVGRASRHYASAVLYGAGGQPQAVVYIVYSDADDYWELFGTIYSGTGNIGGSSWFQAFRITGL